MKIRHLNLFAGAPDYCRDEGYVVFFKIHCTRSEQAMIYLNERLQILPVFFRGGKTPRAVYSDLPHERFDVSYVLLRLEKGCHQAKRVILRLSTNSI